MDIIEINKRTGNKYILPASDNLYNSKEINKEDALTLVLYSCKKTFGLQKTVKIVHGLGVKNL